MATTKEGKADTTEFAQEIARLAEAIRELAHRPETPDSDEDREQRRLIQRVDFGYQALGTLMGRVSRGFAAQFDVPVFAASWHPRSPVILLSGLPDDADWIELRNGKRAETLRVRRGRDEHDGPDEADADDRHGADADDRHGDEQPPWIRPTRFTPRESIDSVLGLRHPRGPVVALGPRIAPVPRYA
jgi:hypothetical protein